MIRIAVVLVVVIVLVLVVARLLGGDVLFRIIVRSGRVQIKGQVLGRSTAEILEFIRGLRLPSGSRISGVKSGDRFRLAFNSAVPESKHQRIRNFLYLKP